MREINYDELIKSLFLSKNNVLVGINKEINEFKQLILGQNNNEDNYSFIENIITKSFNDSNCESCRLV